MQQGQRGVLSMRLRIVTLLLALAVGAGPVAVAATGPGAGVPGLPLGSETSAWSWGRNAAGQLADGIPDHRDLPVPVRNATGNGRFGDVVAIAASSHQRVAELPRGFSLALDRGGQVWAWGRNDQGQLGGNAVLARNLCSTLIHMMEPTQDWCSADWPSVKAPLPGWRLGCRLSESLMGPIPIEVGNVLA